MKKKLTKTHLIEAMKLGKRLEIPSTTKKKEKTTMSNDPGLFTDSTGEGMAGATDVSLETQQELKDTVYNGSRGCQACGILMNPVQSLLSEDICPSCKRRKLSKLVKGRMA